MFEVWKLETTQTLDGCKENYRQGEREERERKPRQDTITLNERSRDDEHEKRNGDGRYNYYDENLVEVEGKKEKMKQSSLKTKREHLPPTAKITRQEWCGALYFHFLSFPLSLFLPYILSQIVRHSILNHFHNNPLPPTTTVHPSLPFVLTLPSS
ncbi:hypothetical protein BLNAU_14063 [Blattamonas nauphoetae]|uniref:Uncharacterized protein n=1 Tax=Blattamonas nauphoetae TaxID=2049346 RepID=A0ABQ9XIF0_9EUKA|nr:hypothetical protein BLNAU_14063 [Blattamonas nauphoetae]